MYSKSNLILFFISPAFMVIFSLFIWYIFIHTGNRNGFKYFFLAIIVLNGLLTFFFLFPGWSRGSFYRSLGGYRSSAQCISYEAVFFFCIILITYLFFSFNIAEFKIISQNSRSFLVLWPVLFIWILSVIAESNRTPFDFAEGERELVSGFNTEYGSGLFSIIFLREYIRILFYSFITSFFIFGESSLFLLGIFLFLLLYVWIRTAFPRLRYDKLMSLSWKSIIFSITSLLILILPFIIF